MNISRLCRPLLVVASLAVLTISGLAGAEPPMRATRLGYVSGTVSFSPAGEGDWLRARVNRPLTRGDRLWVEDGSRAELQIGGATIRLGGGTSVTLLNFDDRMTQLQLSQGNLKIRVRSIGAGQSIEVNTPNLAFVVTRAGEYRINVDADGDSTAVRVASGRAALYGRGSSYIVGTQQGYRFYGSGLSDYERLAMRDDDLDRWARERDRSYDRSPSARYVSYEVVGYQDLDSHGSWGRDPEYGNVWSPNRVSADWAPFRDGHWSWVDPWGWTWVDDAPWGYAVSHYGRWANRQGRWVWVPGPQRERAVYAPAQVAFVGGRDFGSPSAGIAVAAALIGWFALAPREVYQPSYTVSRSYFDRLNRSNAAVAPGNVTIVYNNYTTNTNVTNVTYANQRVRGGVVAVPAQAFTQSQPVAKASVPVSTEAAAKAPVTRTAAVAPAQQSVQGGAPAASERPRHRDRAVVARTAPPPPPPALAAQLPQLAATPGKPIEEAKRREMKPAPAAAAAAAVVVTKAPEPAPSAAPPAKAPEARSPEQRKAETAKADAARPEGGRGEGRRRDGDKADTAKSDAGKADGAKADAAKADAAKADAARADAAKADAAKADAAKGEAARRDAAKADAAKADAAKAEAARKDDQRKGDSAKRDRDRDDGRKADSAKRDRDRDEAAKADAARAEAAKAQAAKAQADQAAAAKAQAAQAEAAKAQAAQAAAAKAQADQAAAAKAQADQAAAAKAQAAQAAAAKAQADQAAAAKAQADQAAAAKAQAAQAAAAKAQADQAAAAKAQADQAAAAKAQADQAAAAKAQAAQAEAAKAAAAKAEAAKAEAAKAAAAQAAAAAAAKATGAQGAAVKAELTDAEKAARRAARKARGEKEDDDKK